MTTLPAELEALCDASALVAAIAKVNARRWSEGLPRIDESAALAELEDRCRAVAAAKRAGDDTGRTA